VKPSAPAKAPESLVCDRSSWLMYAQYTPQDLQLEIGYRNGRVVAHSPVYPQTWEDFKAAPSKGRYYNATIRRLTPGEPIKV
jgi:hypothetical protein